LLEGKKYIVRSGAILNSILDMRRGKHSLHFVVDDELLPHAIVNIPNNEKMHIRVFHIIFFIYLFCSFLLVIKSPLLLFTYQSSHSLHPFQTPYVLHIILMDLM
jgi:hypothetical protein